MTDLLDCDAALAGLLALAPPLAAEEVAIADCDGRYLAGDVAARLTLPPADVSAMDGYALRFAGLPGPFRIAQEAAAGRPATRPLGAGEAARIFTGAILPEGADTVAMQEDASVADGLVRIADSGPAAEGTNVRRKGFDIKAGQLLLQAGALLGPARLGLLAAAGHGRLAVHRRPKVALISTGDELLPPGTAPGPGQIIDANGLMLAALLRRAGATVECFGPIPDRMAPLRVAIERARGADLVVTIGGASVGDHDLVKPALVEAGGEIAFWKVAIRPGKPLLAGRIGRVPVVGLPGNPASAFICARVFLWPLLRHLAGSAAPLDETETAAAGSDLAANGPRRHYLRAQLSGGRILPFTSQDSSLFRTLATADTLLVRPAFAPPLVAGEAVAFLRL